MGYKPEIEAMVIFAKAMGGNKRAAEDVQKEEQDNARACKKLPIKMNPSKEAFEALGFVFEEIDDDLLCKATLPEGWTMKADEDGGYWTYLYDAKGRKRASYFYKGAIYDRDAFMDQKQRYTYTYDYVISEEYNSTIYIYVKDNAEGKIAYNAGQCAQAYSDEYKALMDKAKEFLKKNFPEWEDPTKYWDD